MHDLKCVYRWCDPYGGGLVIADSILDAKEKLIKKYTGADRDFDNLKIWPWLFDEYFDEENPDVLDIYG